MTETTASHVPVLLDEVLHGLEVRPGRAYIDATVGAGQHAAGILRASAPDGRLLGLDADPDAIAYASETLGDFGQRVTLICTSYRHMGHHASSAGFGQVDGVVMDLGLSTRQLADGQRGFSFLREGPLDMRFNPQEGQPASELVNCMSERELAELLWRYGEERQARRIAKAIVASRPIGSTVELAGLIQRAVGHRPGAIHPATRAFQALRIAVNDELAALSEGLRQVPGHLRPGGRLVVISFHSLEDRLVKQFLRLESSDCICPPAMPVCGCGHRATLKTRTQRPVVPTPDEIRRNPSSRSAKLRIAERLG